MTGKEGAPAHDGMGKLCLGPASLAAVGRTEHHPEQRRRMALDVALGTEGECRAPQDREWGGPGGTLNAAGTR